MYQYHSLSPGVLVTAQERAVRPLLSGRLGSALAFNKLTRISGLQDGLQIEKQNIVKKKKRQIHSNVCPFVSPIFLNSCCKFQEESRRKRVVPRREIGREEGTQAGGRRREMGRQEGRKEGREERRKGGREERRKGGEE